jgi:hypothetical protein
VDIESCIMRALQEALQHAHRVLYVNTWDDLKAQPRRTLARRFRYGSHRPNGSNSTRRQHGRGCRCPRGFAG